MLNVNRITTEYSGMKAIKDVSITVGENEVVAIVGSNGAGKSTLLKTISGTAKPKSGEIHFMDADITRVEAHTLARWELFIFLKVGRCFHR